MNQERIDELTAQLNAGNAEVVSAIKAETAEVKEAIANSSIDTTELEKAIAANAQLKGVIEGIYTPETTNTTGETGETAPTETTETTTTEAADAATGTSEATETDADLNESATKENE